MSISKKDIKNDKIEITKEIRRFLLNALKNKGWYFFDNSQLCKCWEEMDCDNIECPSYKSSNLRCWQVAGTFCNGEPQGKFARKFGNCQKCKVFEKATEGDIFLEIGEDFNNLMFQLKSKEDELKSHIKGTEKKNRELTALNKKINGLLKRLDGNNKRLKELSIKDDLTGLYNYRFFRKILMEQYKLSKRYKFPLACIMIDIDYFKAVNDTYGHQFGDAVLKQLADILKNNVRDTDKIVRYGGEEFAILFPYTDNETAYTKAEKLRQIVNDSSFIIKGEALGITISIGIASYPFVKKITRAERLVNLADEALYQAKSKGRNQTVIYTNVPDAKELSNEICMSKEPIMEKRKYPRIKTLIKVKGEINREDLSFVNTVDISSSGVRVLSQKPVDCDKMLKVELYLPDINKKNGGYKKIVIEGLAIRCETINVFSASSANSMHKTRENYLIGIQFRNILKEDRKYLQRYFVSMFKMIVQG